MKNKPNLDDYGITQEEWDKFTESEETREYKQEINPWKIMFFKILIGIAIVLLIKAGVKVMLWFSSNGTPNVWEGFFDAPQLIGFAIGFALWGYLDYRHKIKNVDKEADDVLEGLSAKKIEMLHKYKNAIVEYENAIQEKEMEIKRLNNEINSCKDLLKLIDEDVLYTYNTEDLKGLILQLNDGYSECTKDLFDFVNKKHLIKCIGCDSFLTKIELKEMIDFMTEGNYDEITIYSNIDIDDNLIKDFEKINIVKKEEIKKLFKDSVSNDIEELKKELLKVSKE